MAIFCFFFNLATAQDPPVNTTQELEKIDCNGVYITYTFISRTKEFPFLKNVTAQPWAFKSAATITNAGLVEIKNWKIFVGFQNHEILVSAGGAVVDADTLPADVGNGTTVSGFPQTDLKTAVMTAGDLAQIQAKVEFTGSVFGIRPPGFPMPKTIRLVKDGYRCPAAARKGPPFNLAVTVTNFFATLCNLMILIFC